MSNSKLKRLYELTNEIAKMEPWEWLYDIDILAIQPRRYLEPFFVSIMGYQGSCYGISVYYGGQGLADFGALSQEDPGMTVSYLMSDITCWTCYYAQENELDDETIWEFEDFGLVPYREDRYFYFLSFQPRFYPVNLDEEEINTLVDVYEGLYITLKDYFNEHSVNPDWEKNEIIFACEDEEGWHFSVVQRPNVDRDYTTFCAEDEYIEELSQRPRVGSTLALELIYCNMPVLDEKNRVDRPLNPLFFVAQDLETEQFVDTLFLDLEDDEVEFVVDFFTDYIENVGIPDEIIYHNPYIRSAIMDICDRLDIDLIYDDLEDINEFLEKIIEESNE